ncbi:hypothetical protein Acr_00g0081250 [Actinidia rufa]|uniref:Uncharacterized protein n=1 Tax=Actinidia rufa TaxID=165716 RepID=A0A7J0DUM5_9ERIC|nr:hypothetical protein Acr_00g0081250 [Actinidia rufa]
MVVADGGQGVKIEDRHPRQAIFFGHRLCAPRWKSCLTSYTQTTVRPAAGAVSRKRHSDGQVSSVRRIPRRAHGHVGQSVVHLIPPLQIGWSLIISPPTSSSGYGAVSGYHAVQVFSCPMSSLGFPSTFVSCPSSDVTTNMDHFTMIARLR